MERRGGLNGITPYVSLPACCPHTQTHTHNTHCGQKTGAGEPHTRAASVTLTPTLHSEGYLSGSSLGMLFSIFLCCFFLSSMDHLEFILDSRGCFQEVGMLTLAIQSR